MPTLVTATMTKSLRDRPGVRGLESEQRGEDDDRAVFAARARTSDGRRAAQLGGTRRPRPAAAAL